MKIWGLLILLLKYKLLTYIPSFFLGLIQGFLAGPWIYNEYQATHSLLLDNKLFAKANDWFYLPDGRKWMDMPLPPFKIQQLYDPLRWTEKVGLEKGIFERWDSLEHLHRRKDNSSDHRPWHHWIYASPSSLKQLKDGSLNGTYDPWDHAFSEMLEHYDEQGHLSRKNFHYLACPDNSLCGGWHITAPALLHFTTEKLAERDSKKRPSKKDIQTPMPDHDPVSVRLFELPLRERVVPGVFPSYLEQMRAITSINSTFWMTQDEYTDMTQLFSHLQRRLQKIEKTHPWTYGALVNVEKKWTGFLSTDHRVSNGNRVISLVIGCLPALFAITAWEFLLRWMNYDKASSSLGMARTTEDDPLALVLQEFLDAHSKQDGETYWSTEHGARLMAKMQHDLDTRVWWDTMGEINEEVLSRNGKARQKK